MPYYPEDQSQENINKVIQTNVCKDCGRQLYAFLDRSSKQTYIACPTPGHEGIVREYQPPSQDYRTEIRREIELEKQHGRETSTALAHIPKQGQLTRTQAEKILSLVYPGVPHDDIVRTAMFCEDFGLHPLAKEVYLIPFKDKQGVKQYAMVVGIPANRKMAHALKGAFSFLEDTPRAANPKEIIKQFGENSEEAKSNVISVTKLKGEGGNLALGFGLWPKGTLPYGMDKGNTQRNMANIRSERQAMDRLPGRAMPRVEVVDDAYIDVPFEVRKVDTKTGEIVEGEARELPDSSEEPKTEPAPEPEKEHWCEEHGCQYDKKVRGRATWYAHKIEETSDWCNEKDKKAKAPNDETSQPEPKPEPPKPEPDKQRRDPSTISTINDLFKACNADFKLQPDQVIKELGVSSQSDISDTPEICYQKIAAVR